MASPKNSEKNLENLLFDPKNPRLPRNVDGRDRDEVLDYMIRSANVTDLMQSISESGFYTEEPLLVVPKEKGSDDYYVVEGNRRLAAVMLLNDPDLAKAKKKAISRISEEAKNKPRVIPVLQYDIDDRAAIYDYLGYRHITGVQEWKPLAKAQYINELYTTHYDDTIDEPEKVVIQKIAKLVGSSTRPDYVARLLTGLKLHDYVDDQAYEELTGSTIEFSLITTALSYKSICEFIGISSGADYSLRGLKEEESKELFLWMFEQGPDLNTRVSDSRNIKQLAKVVANDVALSKFRDKNSLSVSYAYTGAPDENFYSTLVTIRQQLEAANSQYVALKDPSSDLLDILGDIRKLATGLRGGLESMYFADEDD